MNLVTRWRVTRSAPLGSPLSRKPLGVMNKALSGSFCGVALLVVGCSQPRPVTRAEALELAKRTLANFKDTNDLGQKQELVAEVLDQTSGTRIFTFKSGKCELQIDVTAQGASDPAGMTGACPTK